MESEEARSRLGIIRGDEGGEVVESCQFDE